ncbi:MAG: VOC family protein [Dehalococcoidales bacterium]|nr:VOC family protein [Dehalococcoidales bacterium]
MDKKIYGISDFSKLGHVGVVVKDINKAIAFLEKIGIGPFDVGGGKKTFTIPFKGELHGRPAQWKTTISFAKMGDTELELLEPTEGPQALKESLDETGEGLHHIGFLTDDLDAEIENFKKNGIGIWTIAREEGGGGFLYSDPAPVGGVAIEFRKIGAPPSGK